VSNLILDSLEIRNFRGLKELRIEKLGRVNLIVGKNNVGKTSVLEALRLYANPGHYETLIELLQVRDLLEVQTVQEESIRRLLPYTELFYSENRSVWLENDLQIKIGNHGLESSTLTVSFPSNEEVVASGLYEYGYYLKCEYDGEKFACPLWEMGTSQLNAFYQFAIHRGFKLPSKRFEIARIDAGGLPPDLDGVYWDRIALTEREDYVIFGLRLISSSVDRLILKPVNERAKKRVPFVKLSGQTSPVSLKSLGDGMSRVFGIVLSLVNAQGGFCLIDEYENGLHYSVQSAIWQLVFNLASRLNIQVFATTHSYDCIRAFQEAAKESAEEGILIGLVQKKGRLFVGEYDEEELGVAVEAQIEVRG